MKEKLQEYVGQVVAVVFGGHCLFNKLQTDGTKFGFPNVAFMPEQVEELNKIEVESTVNIARATIILK